PNTPTSTAVILTADPDIPFDRDEAKWRDEVVSPMWQLINESVAKPAQLRQVNTFDAQIAGDTQRDALMALTLSLIIIMAYIWLRFGNLKFGTATVLAMLHDTILVIRAIGLSHYLAGNFLGHILLIEPFRLNLTM